MKTIKKFLKTISFLMSFLILFTSCNQYDDDITNYDGNNTKKGQITRFSGEQIFRGLFFYQNKIPKNIPHLKSIYLGVERMRKNNDKLISSLNGLSDITVSYIKVKYPKYFSKLQETMYSGNLFEIKKSLYTSAKMIKQAIMSSKEYSSDFLNGQNLNNDNELLKKLLSLDLNTDEGVKEFELLLSTANDYEDVNNKSVAFVIIIVVAVAIAIVAIETEFWAANKEELTDVMFSGETNLMKELIVADIDNYFSNQN